MCMLCPENQIKSFADDTINCTACNEESEVNNAEHTACGEAQRIVNIFILEGSALIFQCKTCLLLRETVEQDAN